jgi:hypothetical protein
MTTTTTITSKSGRSLRIRVMRGANTCHGALVARNGRVVWESDVIYPAFAIDAAERDARAAAARI